MVLIIFFRETLALIKANIRDKLFKNPTIHGEEFRQK